MAKQVKTYNFKQVQAIFGINMLSGFAEGDDCVKIEFDDDQWSLSIGADGEGSRSKSNNFSAKITIKLKATSDSNVALQDAWIADKVANAGLLPLMIKDGSGNSLWAAEQAWVMKQPAASLGKNAGDREWVLQTDSLLPREGGNN